MFERVLTMCPLRYRFIELFSYSNLTFCLSKRDVLSKIAVNSNREKILVLVRTTVQKTCSPHSQKTLILILHRFVLKDLISVNYKTKTLDIKVEEILQIGEKIKSSGNLYFKKEDFVNANRKYKKALRYLNKLHESDMSDEMEKRILSLELPCLLNRYWLCAEEVIQC